MNAFTLTRAETVGEAVAAFGSDTHFIGGGTNLVDLMKANVERPKHLVDLTRLPLDTITGLPDGGLRLGALVTNAVTAYNPVVAERYPLLSRTILAGASPQLRNVATNGGNLLQRTRCYYFYDTATPCNKREPGTGCPAIGGVNRIHAILGQSDQCIATHPSDMCVALAALEAVVQVTGPDGPRSIPFADFHRLPGDTPRIDTDLKPGEVVTSIDLPAEGYAANYTYVKVRDRASYAFAIVSAAVGVVMDGHTISKARIALGGVAHKPWRVESAEALLVGKPATKENFTPVAEAIVAGAHGYEHNAFKVELAKRVVVRALSEATGLEPRP